MYDLFQSGPTKEIRLRDYQADAIEALRDSIRAGQRRLILCAGTGAGKTLTSAHMLKEAAGKGSYTLFIVDRVALTDQTSAVFDEYGIHHGVVQGDHPRWMPRENVQVCSAQTLARRKLPRDPDLIIVDEAHCFAPGTMIATPKGGIPIEKLAEGDLVYNAFGIGYVRHLFHNETEKEIVRVTLEDGTQIECTADHRFFTENAWVQAGKLDGQSAVCIEGMSHLWRHISPAHILDGEGELVGGARSVLESPDVLLSELCKEIEKPHAIQIVTQENGGHIEGDKACASRDRWEWAWTDRAAAENARLAWDRLDAGVCGECVAGPETTWHPQSLQDRHSQSGKDDSDRGGRCQSQFAGGAREGRPQGRLPFLKRVVGVESIKRGCVTDVFNIEVSGHPSYFANGVLAHNCQYKSTLEYIGKNPQAVVVGLTATPFTAGMGDFWHGVVNVIPTRELIRQGHLIEPKIYVARSPEDGELGLNSYGEFSDKSAEAAGVRIVGDVVQEWIDKTRENFGGPVKTIVFSPTVDHGRELCAAFAAAGFNFQQISYLDRSEDERREKIEEFRRPDSIIDGLVSCGVLTKGFDVPDVRCIASGQRVLTDKGLVPIEKVTLGHKVWDGIEYVSHQGVIFKGYQDVIEYAGLVATADHEVHTEEGWRTLGDCAAEQIFITTTGFDECAIRADEGYFTRSRVAKGWPLAARAFALRMLGLRQGICPRYVEASVQSAEARLSPLLSQGDGSAECDRSRLAGAEVQGNATAVHGRYAQSVAGLRGARDRVSLFVSACLRAVGGGEPRRAEAGSQYATGSRGQQWALRAGQSPLGIEGAELQQHAPRRMGRNDAQVSHGASEYQVCGQDPAQLVRDGADIRASGQAVSPAVGQTKRPVWDILQAGPRNRFTCEGLLVHNCGISCRPYRKSLSSHMQEIGRVMRTHPEKDKALWLDHSGNIERFALDMFDVWDNGAGELSHASKRDSKARERNQTERAKVVCPECSGALRGITCMACGWEKPARSGIHAVDGEMQEFSLPEAMEPRAGLRAECLKDPRKVWEAILWHKMTTMRDQDRARKAAYASWKGVYPGGKLGFGWFDMAPPAVVDPGALALAERETKRYRKNSRRAA